MSSEGGATFAINGDERVERQLRVNFVTSAGCSLHYLRRSCKAWSMWTLLIHELTRRPRYGVVTIDCKGWVRLLFADPMPQGGRDGFMLVTSWKILVVC